MNVPFEKVQGLGNDFVIVRAGDLGDLDVGEHVRAWCDRHRGIGADGVIVLADRDESSGATFAMTVHNADGSVPEVCGNGIRCAVVSWAAQRGLAEGEVVVITGAGPKRCRFGFGQVTVDMGPARLDDYNLPVREAPDGGPARVEVEVLGSTRHGLAVSMGNPHLVIFTETWGPIDAADASPLEHHPAFPQRANVSFATEPAEGRTRVVVWERGVGFTQACGSAACAVAVAAAATGRVAGDPATLEVELPGGALHIEVSSDRERVAMSGPSELVFRGMIEVGPGEVGPGEVGPGEAGGA